MRIKILALLLVTSYAALAQNTKEGLRELDRENYRTAEKIFISVAKSSGDQMDWYYLGNAFCFLGKNDSARWAYSQGVAADNKSTACLVGMGKTYLNENKTADAQKYFDQAKSFVNTNKDVNIAIYLGEAYVHAIYPNANEAIQVLNNAINNISDKSAQARILLGEAYTDISDGGNAVTNYEHASDIDKNLARPYSCIGDIWDQAKQYNLSLTNFQKAIGVDSGFAPAYEGLADLYYHTNQYTKAQETFARYLKLAEYSDATQYKQAKFLFLSKDYPGALKILKQLMQKNATAEMYRLAGYSNYEIGNYNDALNDMKSFFDKDDPRVLPLLSSDYEYLANTYKKTGNDTLWALNLRKEVKMDTTKAASTYGMIADTLYKKKQYGKAAVFYELKISKSPVKNASDYYYAGLSFYLDSAYKRADTAFMYLTHLTPSNIPIGYLWRARSNMLLEKKDSTKGLAIPYLDTLVQRAKLDSVKYGAELKEGYRDLADLYYNMKQTDLAISYYEKYVALNPSDAEDIKKFIESVKNAEKNKKAQPKK